jgi:hypothetical protein
MTIHAFRYILASHLVKSGLREVEHPVATASRPFDSNKNSAKRIRKPISLANGFRKHVISTFIEAGLNHEMRELIVDHNTQLDQHYFRPSEDQVLREYLKAEQLLTRVEKIRDSYGIL